MADQTLDPWAELLNGWCGKPWEPVDRGSLRWCPHCDTSAMAHRIGVARDAERQQHQQEIARLMTMGLPQRVADLMLADAHADADIIKALTAEIEQHQQTIQQQAEQIETLTQALKKYAGHDSECGIDKSGSTWQVVDGCTCGLEEILNTIASDPPDAGASRPTEGEQGRLGNYYGRRLTASIEDGQVLVAIGVQTLAHAVAYADWANPFDEASDDYIRTFAIADAGQFAKDVVSAMLAEREDGSTPLSDFLDKMSQAAIEDGSLGLHEDEHRIKHGETAPCETWAEPEQGAPQ